MLSGELISYSHPSIPIYFMSSFSYNTILSSHSYISWSILWRLSHILIIDFVHDGLVLQHHIRIIVQFKCCDSYKCREAPVQSFSHLPRVYPQLMSHDQWTDPYSPQIWWRKPAFIKHHNKQLETWQVKSTPIISRSQGGWIQSIYKWIRNKGQWSKISYNLDVVSLSHACGSDNSDKILSVLLSDSLIVLLLCAKWQIVTYL